MTQNSLDELVYLLRRMLEARELNVLRTVAEGARTRRVVFELHHGSEISLQSEFGFHLEKDGRALSVTYTLAVRWPRAEEIMRDLRPPSPYGPSALTPEVIEARNMLYPIAQLRIDEDRTYFRRPSPVRFGPSEIGLIPGMLAEVIDVLIERAIPEFTRYCDADNLARAAPEPEEKSRLLMAPMNVATILALAGKWQEFATWREAYRAGLVGIPIQKSGIPRQHEQYMSALEALFLN